MTRTPTMPAQASKARREQLRDETTRLALAIDERGQVDSENARRKVAEYRVRYHTLHAEWLALTPAHDAECAARQARSRQGHEAEAAKWRERWVALGGEG